MEASDNHNRLLHMAKLVEKPIFKNAKLKPTTSVFHASALSINKKPVFYPYDSDSVDANTQRSQMNTTTTDSESQRNGEKGPETTTTHELSVLDSTDNIHFSNISNNESGTDTVQRQKKKEKEQPRTESRISLRNFASPISMGFTNIMSPTPNLPDTRPTTRCDSGHGAQYTCTTADDNDYFDCRTEIFSPTETSYFRDLPSRNEILSPIVTDLDQQSKSMSNINNIGIVENIQNTINEHRSSEDLLNDIDVDRDISYSHEYGRSQSRCSLKSVTKKANSRKLDRNNFENLDDVARLAKKQERDGRSSDDSGKGLRVIFFAGLL